MFVLAASVVLWSAVSSRATQLVGNLPSNDGGSGQVSIETIRGATFTTAADSGFEVTSVTMRLENYLSASDVPLLTLRTGTSTAPGAVVGSFLAPTSTSNAFADFVFLPTATIQLQANTLYWLVIAANSNTNTFDWARSEPVVTPTGTGTFGFQQISYDAGDTWAEGNNGPHSFAIDGTTVPEPGTVLLFAAGAMAFLAMARRRRHPAIR